MVLESIFSSKQIERNPWEMFLLGGIITLASAFITYAVFGGSRGIVFVTLITIGIIPIVAKLLRREEEMDEATAEKLYRKPFLTRHRPLIEDFFAFFFGVAIMTSILFLFLPETMAENLLYEQMRELEAIRGAATDPSLFHIIVTNNLKVMFFCFLLSFFYATGAVLILVWNATILGLVVGQIARATAAGWSSIPFIMAGFLPHGIFEFAGFFIAAIAGGIVSIAISRHRTGTELFGFVFRDALKLMLLATIVILIGAWIEVGF